MVCCSKSRLDVYIHDYFVKRNLHATARAFQAESRVPRDTVGKIRSKQISRKIVIFFHSLVFSSLMVFFFDIALVCLLFSAIDSPGGFLMEWWSVFWDIFVARANKKNSDSTASQVGVRF